MKKASVLLVLVLAVVLALAACSGGGGNVILPPVGDIVITAEQITPLQPNQLQGGGVGSTYPPVPQLITASQRGMPVIGTYAVTAGFLPTGLSLQPEPDDSGVRVVGTPTVLGLYTFTLTVTRTSDSRTGSRVFSIAVREVPLSPAANSSLGEGVVSQPMSLMNILASTLDVNGSPVGSTYDFIPQGVPAFLTSSVNGNILSFSGTPTMAGTFTFTVIANDTANIVSSAQYTYTFTVHLLVQPSTIPDGTVGIAYDQGADVFTATGGFGAYTFDITSALPPGLTLNGNELTGTPTQAGAFTFTLSATDNSYPPTTGSTDVTITIH